jgi:molecular chaperone GrpE
MNNAKQESEPTANEHAEPAAQGQPDQPDMSKTNGASGAPNGADANAEATTAAQLAEARAEAAKNLDGWQRAAAEFVNYRKRVEKERTETYANAMVDAYKRILPIMDDFDRAIAFVPENRQGDTAIDGFKQIHRKLLNQLESIGVKQINPLGEAFNPAYHEAIGQDDNADKPAGTVTTVLQKGYVYGDKVLRAALVRVAN